MKCNSSVRVGGKIVRGNYRKEKQTFLEGPGIGGGLQSFGEEWAESGGSYPGAEGKK